MLRAPRKMAPLLLLIAAQMSCHPSGSDGTASRPPTDADIPIKVSLESGEGISGLYLGEQRVAYKTTGYSITKRPITKGQIRACVQAGACSGNENDHAGAPYVAANEVTADQARAYCAWIGAKLPTLEHWLHAARNPRLVQRYAWGQSSPKCEQHPGALERARWKGCCLQPPCDVESLLTVGQHPDGASPSGMEDVLLTQGELLRQTRTSTLPACRGDSVCVVKSLSAGGIDAVVLPQNGRELQSARTLGFRCVWEEVAE